MSEAISLRILRLSCVTSAYNDLWAQSFDPAFKDDTWAGGVDYESRSGIGDVEAEWTPDVALRRAVDRRQAQLEIDALVAIALAITADELCTIYRTQFPVLFGYDQNRDHYDKMGRLVPTAIVNASKKGGGPPGTAPVSTTDLSDAHSNGTVGRQHQSPFVTLNREDDLRTAYRLFSSRFADN